jgi:hypothetical protein
MHSILPSILDLSTPKMTHKTIAMPAMVRYHFLGFLPGLLVTLLLTDYDLLATASILSMSLAIVSFPNFPSQMLLSSCLYDEETDVHILFQIAFLLLLLLVFALVFLHMQLTNEYQEQSSRSVSVKLTPTIAKQNDIY